MRNIRLHVCFPRLGQLPLLAPSRPERGALRLSGIRGTGLRVDVGLAPFQGVTSSTIATACPPVVEYTRELQARAADELDLLPEGSAIAEMLADYSVMRTQVRSCGV